MIMIIIIIIMGRVMGAAYRGSVDVARGLQVGARLGRMWSEVVWTCEQTCARSSASAATRLS